MAHYAILDNNNVVIQVIVGKDETDTTENWEETYSQFTGLRVKRTSYNTINGVHLQGGTPFRKNYASPGFTYSDELDAFIPPKQFASWVLDEETCNWKAPIPSPDDTKNYLWDEANYGWIEYTDDL